ncbi:hypothetical protein B0B36_24700 [Pseudomonas syringae pv. actinidifoliorum]|nr:hypothetical protein B0B36_24700 [Pseudomonas syringae pv. actinidifoliorum]
MRSSIIRQSDSAELCLGSDFKDMTPNFNYRADALKRFVTLCVAQRFCDVISMCFRLKSPFRPSATDFEGSK